MEVVWTISPADSGAEVTIFHELSSPRWWLRLGLTQFIVGQWFVAAIAAKTLAAIKWHAEGGT
jgi:hypothetical protein